MISGRVKHLNEAFGKAIALQPRLAVRPGSPERRRERGAAGMTYFRFFCNQATARFHPSSAASFR